MRSRIGGAEFGLSAMAGSPPGAAQVSTFSCRTSTGTTSRASPSSSPLTSLGTGSASTAATTRSPTPSGASTARRASRWSSQLGSTIEFVQLVPGEPYEVAGLRVTAKRQFHSGDSYAYRFERDGKVMVYSTDSEHKLDHAASAAEFADFFRDADLVIFDAMYSLADAFSIKEDWGHRATSSVLSCARWPGSAPVPLPSRAGPRRREADGDLARDRAARGADPG